MNHQKRERKKGLTLKLNYPSSCCLCPAKTSRFYRPLRIPPIPVVIQRQAHPPNPTHPTPPILNHLQSTHVPLGSTVSSASSPSLPSLSGLLPLSGSHELIDPEPHNATATPPFPVAPLFVKLPDLSSFKNSPLIPLPVAIRWIQR